MFTLLFIVDVEIFFNDVEGWQNKQFLGRGEFALPFGDYEVNITVPSDHIVGSTGELQNASSVLSAEQRNRFKQASTSDTPILIVTQAEAEAAAFPPGNKDTEFVMPLMHRLRVAVSWHSPQPFDLF